MKFRMFFVTIAMFVLSSVIVTGSPDIWIQQLNWMQNVIQANRNAQCNQQTNFTTMGFTASFYFSEFLFF